MVDLKKSLQNVTKKAKKIVYPEEQSLKRKWEIQKEKDKLKQDRKN